jgi:hypothetical protein
LATHHNVIVTRMLRLCGVSRTTCDRLVRAGVLRNPHKGVFALASAPLTLEHRCAVLCASHPGGFITGPTAGALEGLRRMPRSSALHYAVRHGINLVDEPGVCFRQTTKLLRSHCRQRADGIVVATPGRLAFDIGLDVSPLDHLSILHQLLDQRRVTIVQLRAIGDELCHPARRGSTRFRETLARLSDSSPGQSHPEVVLAEQLRHRGVPVEHQSRVVRYGGRLARVDLAVPEIRWGIELDIHPEHRSLDGHAGDARRYRDLHRLAWQIEPVTESDMSDPGAIADELTELYHARRRQIASSPSVS